MMAPRFSILTPVHDPPLDAAARVPRVDRGPDATRDWELCLVDDGSTDRRRARRAAPSRRADAPGEARRAAGGRRASSPRRTTALAMATGEFVVLVDHDDRLEPDALAPDRRRAARRPARSTTSTPTRTRSPTTAPSTTSFHKPDWSPERLRVAELLHAPVGAAPIRSSSDVGGFRAGFDGSQDHDLILRVTERARRVHHVPAVLYHWCVTPGLGGRPTPTPSRMPGRPDGGPWPSTWSGSGSLPTVEHQRDAGPLPGAPARCRHRRRR